MCLSCHFDNPEWVNDDNIYLIILLRKWLVKQVDCCSDYPAKLSSFTAIQRLLAPVAGDSTFLLLIFLLQAVFWIFERETNTFRFSISSRRCEKRKGGIEQ